MAAASIRVSVVGCPKSQAAGFPGNLARSHFWGSGRVHVASGAPTIQGLVQRGAKTGALRAVRSASFFERFLRLFSPSIADEEQVFTVYEINERDRNSPVFLAAPKQTSPIPVLGDLVPYSNKVFGPSGKDYLGLSAGLCTVIETTASSGTQFETTYTHYLGSYGQLSGMGPYFLDADSTMVVTGGTGIFQGARGIVKIHNVQSPIQLTYSYHITGIEKKLPPELTIPLVPLSPQASPAKPAPVTASA